MQHAADVVANFWVTFVQQLPYASLAYVIYGSRRRLAPAFRDFILFTHKIRLLCRRLMEEPDPKVLEHLD